MRPRQAKDMNPKLSPELAAVLMKAIERERELRYATAADFKAALLACPEALAAGA